VNSTPIIYFAKSSFLLSYPLHLRRVLYAVLEYFQSAVSGFAARVTRMLVIEDMIFRMRHEVPARCLAVTNACNVANGTVRIDRIFSVCRRAVRPNIGECNLLFDVRDSTFGIYLKIPFAVCDGTSDEFAQSFCPDTFLRDGFEHHPAAFKMTLFVKGQCDTVIARVIARSNDIVSWQNSPL